MEKKNESNIDESEEPKINEDILNYFLSRHQTIIPANQVSSGEAETEAEASLIKPNVELINNSIVLSLPAFSLSVSSNNMKMPDLFGWFQLLHGQYVKPLFQTKTKKNYLG